MKIRTVLDGNAFYEIDEECLQKKGRKAEEKEKASGAASDKNRAAQKVQYGKARK